MRGSGAMTWHRSERTCRRTAMRCRAKRPLHTARCDTARRKQKSTLRDVYVIALAAAKAVNHHSAQPDATPNSPDPLVTDGPHRRPEAAGRVTTGLDRSRCLSHRDWRRWGKRFRRDPLSTRCRQAPSSAVPRASRRRVGASRTTSHATAHPMAHRGVTAADRQGLSLMPCRRTRCMAAAAARSAGTRAVR